MASFNAAVTTDQGITLVADLLVGQQIVFTKLVTGSGAYTDEDIERTKLQKTTALRDQRQEFEISSITKTTDTCVLLKTLISNKELTRGYRMTEIGVYAKKQGDEGDGILYSVAVAKEADYFPCYNGFAAVEIVEEYYITVSDSTEVLLQAGSGASVLIEDFHKLKIEITEMENRIDALNEQTVKKSDILKTVEEVQANTDDENVVSATVVDGMLDTLNAMTDDGLIKGMDVREDGVYVTYVPSEGADAVSKKLGEPVITKMSAPLPYSAENPGLRGTINIGKDCYYAYIVNVTAKFVNSIPSDGKADINFSQSYNRSTGILSWSLGAPNMGGRFEIVKIS